MKKKVIVLSLGGSIIIPEEVDHPFLKEFKKTITALSKDYKFIIVCGGGSIARKYINALKKEKASSLFQSFAGISATRMNARFMNYFFGKDHKIGMPHTLETLKKHIEKEDIVFCGALEYKEDQTSDSTATEIANHFKTKFINITNVAGLYDKNPSQNKNAKLIPKINWKEFYKMTKKIKFYPGQHFILDQNAARIIMKHKIPTYIIGRRLSELENILKNKNFRGTLIQE